MAKHLLYLTNNQLTVTVWDNGVFSEPLTFDHYASGWSKFSEYFATQLDANIFLLTDLIEEDFQRENVPHVLGRAQKNLIERRLTALYRDTPYRTISKQGREKEGRRDDHILFSALTNVPLLKPWLDALEILKIHIVGIYSVALLTPFFHKKLDLGKASSLIVSHQSSGLRQSYFQDGYLRFSRLAPETAWSPESIAEMTDVEMSKTRQFLASTRLLARGDPLNIVVIADAEIISYLQPRCPDEGGVSYRFVDLDEAQHVLELKRHVSISLCDVLFLSLLANRHISSHYATAEQLRLNQLLQFKTLLNVASVVSVVIALIWAVNDGLKAYEAITLTKLAQQETARILTEYQITVSHMPVTVANPHDMRSAVEIEQTLIKNAPLFAVLLGRVSQALEGLPQIKIHALTWETSEAVSSASDPALLPPPSEGDVATISGGLLGIPNKLNEVLNLECEVVPFKNDYRSALESAQQFITELQRDPHIQVTMIKPPLDVRPNVKLEAQSGEDSLLNKPQFNLKIMWKP